MGNRPNREYLEKRIELLQMALVREEMIEGRFGNAEDWGDGIIIIVYTKAGYTYVILKVSNDRWYTTAKADNVYGWKPVMTWAQLVDVMVIQSDKVYVMTSMDEI